MDIKLKDLPLAALERWLRDRQPRPAPVSVATTPGTVTGKQPVYDAQGNVLGYVALYDDIS